MGLFDFFKRKDKGEPEKPLVKPNNLGEFNLQLADFSEKIHRSEVLADAWINPNFDPEFEAAIAHLRTGTPMKKGDIIELKTYIINILLWEHKVELTFDLDNASKNINEFVQKINKQLNWIIKSKSLIDEAIISKLLQLKNDSWLDEDQQPVTKEDFIKSMQLISIDFASNAAFDLYFDDGDLFYGHTIIVNVNSKREIKNASIAG
ncbi:MAG: DUF2262 domain-containing protein [Pedobacter sp.]|nr:MAG: DUF2262 domain-containing protein [Pedobacter sp.]